MNLYSLPPLLSAVLFAGLSFFVLRSRRSKVNFTFSMLCLVTFWWQFSWFVLFNTADEKAVLNLVKLGYTGIVFIPIVYFHFITTFLNLDKVKKYRNIVYTFYVVGFVLTVALWSSNYFINGFYKYSWGYYPRAGFLHPVHLLHVVIVTLWMLGLLFSHKKYLKPFFPIKYNQTQYLILGIFSYFPAASDYIINYGVGFYPLGFVFITINLTITFLAIVRYRLMDVTVVIKRTFIFGILFGIAIAMMYLPMFVWQEFLKYALGGAWWIIIGIIFMVILITAFPLYRLLVRLTDRWLFQKKYEYQKTLKEASKGMIKITEPEKLLAIITRFLNKRVRARHTFILVWDNINRHYAVKGVYGKTKIEDIKLSEESSLVKWFRYTKDSLVKRKLLKKKDVDVLVKEEVEHWVNDTALLDGHGDLRLELHNILSELESLEGSVTIPSFYKGHLLGILILGDKLSGDIYTQEDLDILSTLANDAAIAVKNAQLFSDLSQEKGKMMAVFNNMSDGAVLTDTNLNVIMFNEASCSLLNLAPVDFLNKNFAEIIGDFNISPSLEEIQKIERRNFICEMARIKGQPFFISNKVNKIVNDKGNTLGYIMILRDVTDQRTEEVLKKNFLALVSHKLRTPLTPIMGYAQLLLMQESLTDSQKNMIQDINERSQILSELINELISFTTLESETIELKKSPVSFNMLVQSALSNIKSLIEKSQAKVFIDDSLVKVPRVYVDEHRIKETIANLVENAIKFNNKELREVKIYAFLTNDGFIQVKIQDNGLGIPGEEFDKIFQKFYQVEEGFSGQVEGAGLGLAVVKRVVKLHGGSVWVESKLTEGSTFYFTLPVYQE